MTSPKHLALFTPIVALLSAWSGAAHAGAFVALEWRGYAIAEHLSHGPAFAAGASLWDDHLRIGVAGTARPGPMNPHTFALDVPSGDYKGQETLQLRSDGAAGSPRSGRTSCSPTRTRPSAWRRTWACAPPGPGPGL
ncbi:hypothetical protein L6R49_12635 [Myxococcota bacterium]|nr:hypothetical protein [Myxococcota bacterium]